MPVTAEARIKTESASRYLVELCQAIQRKSEANPGIQASVAWTDTEGATDFGWGRYTLRAQPSLLVLFAEAADQEGLEQVQELLTRHLERFGSADHLRVNWQQAGAPAAIPDHAVHRRDRMRQFHRRVLPSKTGE